MSVFLSAALFDAVLHLFGTVCLFQEFPQLAQGFQAGGLEGGGECDGFLGSVSGSLIVVHYFS